MDSYSELTHLKWPIAVSHNTRLSVTIVQTYCLFRDLAFLVLKSFVFRRLFSSYLAHWKKKSCISKLTSWFRWWKLIIDMTHSHIYIGVSQILDTHLSIYTGIQRRITIAVETIIGGQSSCDNTIIILLHNYTLCPSAGINSKVWKSLDKKSNQVALSCFWHCRQTVWSN